MRLHAWLYRTLQHGHLHNAPWCRTARLPQLVASYFQPALPKPAPPTLVARVTLAGRRHHDDSSSLGPLHIAYQKLRNHVLHVISTPTICTILLGEHLCTSAESESYSSVSPEPAAGVSHAFVLRSNAQLDSELTVSCAQPTSCDPALCSQAASHVLFLVLGSPWTTTPTPHRC